MVGRLRGAAHIFFFGLLGCAAAPPPQPLALVALPAPGTAPVASAPDEVALDDRADEPADLAFSAQLASPARDLPVVGLLLPISPEATKRLEQPGLMVKMAVGPALERAVDLEQPFDMAVPIQEGDSGRFAFGLTLKRAQAERPELREDLRWTAKAGGRFGLEPAREGGAGMIGKLLSCDLWPTLSGGVPRLVCATDPQLLQSYGPFLARGVSRKESRAGLWAHMTGAALRAYSPKPQDHGDGRHEEESEKAGRRMGERWIEQWFEELVSLDAEISLGVGRAEIALEQTFRGCTSLMTALQCAKPSDPQPLPAAFWHLPTDADVALFFQGTTPEVMKPLGAQTLRDLLASIPEDEVPASAHAELTRAINTLFFTGGPLLLAHGHDRADAGKALGGLFATPWERGKKPSPAAEKAHKAARSSLQGWTLAHVDEPPSRWYGGLRELGRVMSKDYAGEAARAAAQAKRSNPGAAPPPAPKKKTVHPTREIVREVAVRPGDGLPKGSLHFVNHTLPNPAYVPSKGDERRVFVEHDIHFFMAPDDDGTWLSAAEDEALARTKLLQAVTHAAPSTLDARAELASLRSSRGAGAGFVTLAGVTSLFLPDESRLEMAAAQHAISRVRALPHVGSSAAPFLWTSTREPRASGGPLHHVKVSMGLDPDTLQDVIQFYTRQLNGGAP